MGVVVTDLPAAIEIEIAKELVKALVVGAVDLVRKVPALFGRLGERRQRQRAEQMEAAAAELAAVPEGEWERAVVRQETLWTERFAELVADHPEAAEELRTLLVEFRAALPTGDAAGPGVVQQVRAGRDAYIAGRDQHFGTGPDRSGA